VFSFNSIEAVVLDEADRMFDLGFIKDIRFLFRRMPLREERQGMLFSATLSHRVLELAYDHMNEPEKLAVETDNVTADRVRQLVYFLRRKRSSRCCSTCCRASTRIAASSS
jgi:ATP-dependent RNA helicase RhlB